MATPPRPLRRSRAPAPPDNEIVLPESPAGFLRAPCASMVLLLTARRKVSDTFTRNGAAVYAHAVLQAPPHPYLQPRDPGGGNLTPLETATMRGCLFLAPVSSRVFGRSPLSSRKLGFPYPFLVKFWLSPIC